MAIPKRSVDELLRMANAYARENRAPAQTVVKELLHFDILEGLVLEGAMQDLVFQGGTCLRLCHNGNRYSEDLDFAGGHDFDPAKLKGLGDVIARRLQQHYDLTVTVRESPGKVDSDGIQVARWQARIEVPQADVSLPQKQVINLEVASVPAHDTDLLPIMTRYPGITLGGRSLIVPAESREEILADKIKAVVSRPYLKARDVWDIRFLLAAGTEPRFDLVKAKIADYGWTVARFLDAAAQRLTDLAEPSNHKRFTDEMSRFLDAPVAAMLNEQATRKYLQASADLIGRTCAQLRAPQQQLAPGM